MQELVVTAVMGCSTLSTVLLHTMLAAEAVIYNLVARKGQVVQVVVAQEHSQEVERLELLIRVAEAVAHNMTLLVGVRVVLALLS